MQLTVFCLAGGRATLRMQAIGPQSPWSLPRTIHLLCTRHKQKSDAAVVGLRDGLDLLALPWSQVPSLPSNAGHDSFISFLFGFGCFYVI